MVDKERIHDVIDRLSPKSLEKANEFVELLLLNDEQKNEDWFGKLYDLYEPVRAGVEASDMTDDEVNQILDEALKEVRDERKWKQNL